MGDPALELVLPEAAELQEIVPSLLEPEQLAELWQGDSIAVQAVLDYFKGDKIVQVQRDGYMEPMPIPNASDDVVNAAITKSVETGSLWLTNGPASVLAEPIPTGVLTPQAMLQKPPAAISAAEILTENLPDAWKDGEATAMSIATALSQKFGQTLPWKTVRDVIAASLNARFTELDPTSGEWPCGYPAAQGVKLKLASGGGRGGGGGFGAGGGVVRESKSLYADAELKPSDIQDLGDIIPQLLEIKNKSGSPLVFRVQIEFGDGETPPTPESTAAINTLLEDLKEGFSLQ